MRFFMNKLSFLFFVFILFFIVIIARLFFIQIFASDRYSSPQYLQTIQIIPARGQIFDRNNQPLVFNQKTYLLYAEPKKINDKNSVIDKLKDIVHLDEATLASKIKSDKSWIPLASNIDKNTKDAIDRLSMVGIGFNKESKRFYPEGSLSAHLLGFVGKNKEGNNIGYFGIEGYYEKDLVGLPGILKTERDVVGRPIFVGVQDQIRGEDGRDLILALDSSIQGIVKDKLLYGMEKYGVKEGCVIIADPYSFEIIALSCLPDFDPFAYSSSSENFFKNPALSTVYEPGSIFKPLIMAAGLNEKAILPEDVYDEKGPINIGQHVIKTWNDKYEGKINMTRILEKSSNVGMVYVGEKIGKKKLYSYLKKYGIGEKTGIDLQGETAGFLKAESQWHPIDYLTVTFGQGVVVTQMQMIRAFASIINGGYIMEPHAVRAFRAGNKEQTVKAKKLRRVISAVTSNQIKKMLESVIENGDAQWTRIKGYRIGGKTGTAQIPIEGQYDPNKTIASFIGFAPIETPKFILSITLKEPTSSPWGSETAAPLFFDLAKELFVYYNIAQE